MGIVIRLRLRRGDYVPVCPAGLQYLAFPSLGGPSVLLGPSVTTISRLSYSPLYRHSFHPSSPFTSFSSSSLRFSKEERRKFEMTADGDRKDGSGEITTESRVERERGVRGGKNCIRSNHIHERHRALRNQLNGEKLVVRRAIARPKRMEGVKEREKAMGLGGSPSRLLCQVDEAGKDEKTDGERRNLQ